MVDKSYYNREMPVSEDTLDQIREMGMGPAIQLALSGQASPEFIEAVRRFYPAIVQEIDKDVLGGSGMPQISPESIDPQIPERQPSEGGGNASPPPSPPVGNSAIERRMTDMRSEGGGVSEQESPGLIDTESRPGKVALNLGALNPVESGVIDTSNPGKVGLDLKRLADVLGLGWDAPDVSMPDLSQVVDTQSRPGKVGLNLGALLGGGGGEKAAPAKPNPLSAALNRRMQNTAGGGRLM